MTILDKIRTSNSFPLAQKSEHAIKRPSQYRCAPTPSPCTHSILSYLHTKAYKNIAQIAKKEAKQGNINIYPVRFHIQKQERSRKAMNKKDRKTPLCKTKSTQKIAEEASGASNTALPQEKKENHKKTRSHLRHRYRQKNHQPPLLKTSTPNIGVSTSLFSKMPSVFRRSKKLWHSPTTIIHSARARPV